MRAQALRLVVAVAAYTALWVSAFTSLYDPLPDLPIGLGLALLVSPNLGLGLAVARWWVPLVPLALALPWAIRGGDTGNVLSTRLESLDVLALGGMGAAFVLAGMLVASSSVPVLARRPWAPVGAGLLAAAVLPLVWATVRHVRPLNDGPTSALVVDGSAGTVEQVGLGDDKEAVVRVFGPRKASATAEIAPLGEDFASLGAPQFIETPGTTHAVLRYQGASFLVSDGSVYAVIVSAGDAETTAGVGVGDNLAVATDSYPGLRCETGRANDRRTFPYCAGRVADGRWIWFGDDPIRSITLASTEL